MMKKNKFDNFIGFIFKLGSLKMSVNNMIL